MNQNKEGSAESLTDAEPTIPHEQRTTPGLPPTGLMTAEDARSRHEAHVALNDE